MRSIFIVYIIGLSRTNINFFGNNLSDESGIEETSSNARKGSGGLVVAT